MAVVHGAVTDALKLSAISRDAVKHLALCRIERRPAKLSLDAYPYLPVAAVETTSAASYLSLLAGGGASAGMTATAEAPGSCCCVTTSRS